MKRFSIRPQAKVDLLEIWDYIARDSIEAANRLADRLDAAVVRVAEWPGIGHSRSDVNDPRYRFYSVGNYIIAYRVEKSAALIIRVVHGARDFRKLFRGRR
jgi:plasmid stabilization system protein ParE